jgi:hypothetical protein
VEDFGDLVIDGIAAGGLHVALEDFLFLEEFVEGVALGCRHLLKDGVEALVEFVEACEGALGFSPEGFVGVEFGVLVKVAGAGAALEGDGSLVGLHKAGEHLEEGALADAVAADDADAFTGLDGERDAIEDDAGAEGVLEVGGGEDWQGGNGIASEWMLSDARAVSGGICTADRQAGRSWHPGGGCER